MSTTFQSIHHQPEQQPVKKRKPRTVKGGYIELDVSDPPGTNFENWIRITKEKLKYREIKLMEVRMNTLQQIVNTECQEFESNNSLNDIQTVTVSNYDKIIIDDCHTLISNCLTKLHSKIDVWQGINLRKTKKSLDTFRPYFSIGKCWFDQQKKDVLAPLLWNKIFVILQEFTQKQAAIYFDFDKHFTNLQQLYAKHLLFSIFSGIFNGTLRFAATKPQTLMSSSILKEDQRLSQFLYRLHDSLNVKTISKKINKAVWEIKGKELLKLTGQQLIVLKNKSHEEFKQLLWSHWDDSVIQTVNAINAPINNCNQTIETNVVNGPTVNNSNNNNNNHNNTNVNNNINADDNYLDVTIPSNNYFGVHVSTYNASTQRHNPLNNANIFVIDTNTNQHTTNANGNDEIAQFLRMFT